MKSIKEIKYQLNKVERLCSLYRDHLTQIQNGSTRTPFQIVNRIKAEKELDVKLPDNIEDLEIEHTRLTEQLAVLRWVYTDLDWDDDGLRDT